MQKLKLLSIMNDMDLIINKELESRIGSRECNRIGSFYRQSHPSYLAKQTYSITLHSPGSILILSWGMANSCQKNWLLDLHIAASQYNIFENQFFFKCLSETLFGYHITEHTTMKNTRGVILLYSTI